MVVGRFKSRRRTETGSEHPEGPPSNGNNSNHSTMSNKIPSPIDTQALTNDYEHILDKIPDAIIAKGLRITGEAKFSRILRIDGAFQGSLISDGGSLIVGETGEVTCNLTNLQELYVEGRFEGDVSAERVQLRKGAVCKGNITCCSLGLDPSARFKGSTNITPRAKWSDRHRSDDPFDSKYGKSVADPNFSSTDIRPSKWAGTPAAGLALKSNDSSPKNFGAGDSANIPQMNFEDEDHKSIKEDEILHA